MKVFFFIVVFCTLLLGGTGVMLIRTTAHDPAEWHVDPLTFPTPESPNTFRVAPEIEGYEAVTTERIDQLSPIYDANPSIISKAWDEFVLRQPRTQRIAGTPEEGWMTYVQTSEYWRFPDYISVLFLDLGNGQSTIAIYSRSRCGDGDLGVNQERINDWLEPLESFVVDAPL